MPRRRKAPAYDAATLEAAPAEEAPKAATPDLGADPSAITEADMKLLNEFIHDPSRADSLRLAALKLKVARETALLKERIAEKSSGLQVTVNTLGDDDAE